MRAPLLLPLALLLVAACSTPESAAPPPLPEVRTWGTMREVLRQGRAEGRVSLDELDAGATVAVGALADLRGEVTVVDGVAHVSEVVTRQGERSVRPRAATSADRAALLVAAEVEAWVELPLEGLADLAALERAVAARLVDPTRAVPFRVEGRAERVELHVLDGACPIARPEGPPPWRHAGEDEGVVLVGFHAPDAVGVLTHHGRSTHTHALLESGVAGHLDAVRLAPGARLWLPAGTAGPR